MAVGVAVCATARGRVGSGVEREHEERREDAQVDDALQQD
jgi:hypothetical protein